MLGQKFICDTIGDLKIEPHNTILTSAPSSFKVSIRTAVWIVMCKQPAILAPFKGFSPPNCFRRLIKPGISFSAKEISLRPQSANFKSAVRGHDKNATKSRGP